METMHLSVLHADSSDREILDKYFKEVRRIRMLSQEEEIELIDRFKEGDAAALERLTKANLRFVIKIARQYRHYGVPLNDLISEGNIGLIRAIRQFNPDRGTRLITYAVWWIKQNILKAISAESSFINLPQNKYWNFQKIRRELNRFEQEHQRMPEPDELSDYARIDRAELEEFLQTAGPVTSLNNLFNKEGEEMELASAFGYGSSLTDNLKKESLENELQYTLNKLNESERRVIQMSFGIGTGDQFTLEEIALETGISKSKARRLRESAIRKLRRPTFNSDLRQYFCA